MDRDKDQKATWARSDGKLLTTARTMWTLTIGGKAFRCLRDTVDQTRYEVEIRDKNWKALASGKDPADLLRRLVGSKPVQMLVKG